MNKRFAIIVMALLLQFNFAMPARAYTKSFDQFQIEYDDALQRLKEVNTICAACEECIAAFNAGNQEKLDSAYGIICDAGLMPKHYKIKDTSMIETYLSMYERHKEANQLEVARIIEYQSYWFENASKIKEVFTKAIDGDAEIFPVINTNVYSDQVIYGFPRDFFEEGNDLSGLMGNIYLIPGTVVESHPEEGYCFIKYLDDNYGERLICAMLPSGYDKRLDYIDGYDLPDIEKDVYFCLTFFIKREEDGLKFFYIGADDLIINDLRLLSPIVYPDVKD